MKRTATVLILFLLTISIFAGSFIDLGIKLEKEYMDVSAFEYEDESYLKMNGENKLEGYNFGFYTRINFFIFSIQPEIYYLHSVNSFSDVTGLNGANYDNLNSILEIPVLLRMQFYGWLFNLSLFGGPNFSIPVVEGLNFQSVWETIRKDAENGNFDAVVGIGIDFPLNNLRLSADGRVAFGLESARELEEEERARDFKLSFSIGIGLKTF